MNIIRLYAPTANGLGYTKRLTKKGGITIIMGNFNSKVGYGIDVGTVGRCRLLARHERNRLFQFCVKQELLITNTFFKLHPRNCVHRTHLEIVYGI